MDQSPPTDAAPRVTLPARAVEAYHEERYETAAGNAARANAERDRTEAAAVDTLTAAFGPDVVDRLEWRRMYGHDHIVATIAGAQLSIDPEFPQYLRGLVICAECEERDARTVDNINTLPKLGQLLDDYDSLRLLGHETATGDYCDGTGTARPVPPPAWAARYAMTSEKVAEALNDLEHDDYVPFSITSDGEHGWLITAQRNDLAPEDPF